MNYKERVKNWEETKKITLELNDFEVTELLRILGVEQNRRFNQNLPIKTIEYLITKIYRAMGVNL